MTESTILLILGAGLCIGLLSGCSFLAEISTTLTVLFVLWHAAVHI